MTDAHAQALDAWLTPFLAVMGRKTRRRWAPFYLRGLLGPGERKSLQPMAQRLGLSGHDQLQHFIASPAWDDGPLWTELARAADRLVGGAEACLVIDDTALPKKGTLSVGVARQSCGQLGKKANCQAMVSLTPARGEVPVPVALRLFLPEEWLADPQRCAQAGVPEAAAAPQSKGEIALAELDRLRAVGLRFGVVLADAGDSSSPAFRQGLDARGLLWAVGIGKTQKVYGADVQRVPPPGRARKPVPDQEPREAEAVLAALPWRHVTWRQGTKGKLAARFAVTRVRVGDGETWGNNRHLPGQEVWLVGEWRSSGERKYYLSNLPPFAGWVLRNCSAPDRRLRQDISAEVQTELAGRSGDERGPKGSLRTPHSERLQARSVGPAGQHSRAARTNIGGNMRVDIRAPLLAAAVLTSVVGFSLAAGGASNAPGAGQAGGRGDVGASTGSMGAGGMSGTGATKNGARTGTSGGNPTTGSAGSSGASRGGNPTAPAPGTSR